MKRMISNLMLVAAAATAFFSCQKQEMNAPEVSAQEMTLTFASEKPAFDDETKTEWTGETVQWSAGDRISIAYTVDGTWQNASGDASGDAKLYKSEVLEAATESAQFNVSADFNGTGEGVHVFYGVYPAPSGTGFADAPVASLEVPAIQTPKAASFDGNADLMTGVSVDEFSARPASGETISMKWTRLVAHANITLKALKDVTAGERVSSISLTAQEGANLVGKQKVNLLTNEVVNDDAASNVLDLNGGNLSIDANGNIEFWACVLPETLTSLTVVVETDKATYSREITGISKTFKQNARNTLSVKMDAATRVEKDVESWVLVTPADGLTEGTYALVASTSTKTGALVSSNGSGSAPTFEMSVSVEDNLLYGVTDVMQFDITGSAGNWVLSVAGDASKWLYCTATNNGVRVGTNTNKTWTISAHEKNSDAFVVKHNTTSRFLGVYNNQDWRCYDALTKFDVTGNTGAIYFYKKTSGAVVPDTTPRISVSEKTIEVEADATSAEFAYTLHNVTGTPVVTVAEGATMSNVSASADNGTVTVEFLANAETVEKSATIILSIDGAEDVEVVLTQKGYVDPSLITEVTVKEFLAKSVDANVWYKLTGTISNIANTTYGNFDLTDDSGTVYVYGLTSTQVEPNDKSFASIGLKEGDVVTLIGTRDYYESGQKDQVGGPAYYVSHVSACAAPVITCTDNTVTITAESGSTIYYTTNGDVPTESSTKYTASFPITEDTTVKAIAVATGKPNSVVAECVCTYVDPNAESIEVTMEIYANKGTVSGKTISWTKDGFTCINEQGNSSTAIRTTDSDHHRVYANSTLKFTASEKTFNEVVVTCTTGSYASTLKTSAEKAGYTATVSSSVVTISTAETSAISMTASAQIRINKVKVVLY